MEVLELESDDFEFEALCAKQRVMQSKIPRCPCLPRRKPGNPGPGGNPEKCKAQKYPVATPEGVHERHLVRAKFLNSEFLLDRVTGSIFDPISGRCFTSSLVYMVVGEYVAPAPRLDALKAKAASQRWKMEFSRDKEKDPSAPKRRGAPAGVPQHRDRAGQVLEVLRAKPMTVAEVAAACGAQAPNVRQIMVRLSKRGYVRVVGVKEQAHVYAVAA